MSTQVEATGVRMAFAHRPGAASNLQRTYGPRLVPPGDCGATPPRSRHGDRDGRGTGANDKTCLAPVGPALPASDVDDLPSVRGGHRKRTKHQPIAAGAVGKLRVKNDVSAGRN